MATRFSGGRSRKEPPTMGKQLVNFITCSCESSATFFVIYKAAREPTPDLSTTKTGRYDIAINIAESGDNSPKIKLYQSL